MKLEDKDYLIKWVLAPLAIGLLFIIITGAFQRCEKKTVYSYGKGSLPIPVDMKNCGDGWVVIDSASW